MGMRFLFTFELTPGMIAAEDVYSVAGHLIVEKNTVLTTELISMLRMNNITDIRISDELPAEPAPSTTPYLEKLLQSEDFKEFQESFNDNIDTFRSNINDVILKNEPINVSDWTDKCNRLLDKTSSSFELFNMLQAMKQFNDSMYSHCINVALIATMLGRWLNFSDEDIDTLMLAGLFHDIGKLTVPDKILNKPGKLTPAEYDVIKQHPSNGYNILKERNLDVRIKEACLLHHERCDGTGYPYGLKADKLPSFAKIISIADVYDAMTSQRCYHDPLCPFIAIETMEQDAYNKYDPGYITTFLENIVSSYINNTVRLSDGRIGEIVMLNKVKYSKPIVKCGDEFVDLLRTPGIFIEELI